MTFEDNLWMEQLSDCLTNIYHFSLGSDEKQQQLFAMTELKRLFAFDSAYWLQCSESGEKKGVITLNLDANTKRRLDRAFDGKKSVKDTKQLTEQPSHSLVRDKVDSVFRSIIERVKGLPNNKILLVRSLENKYHCLLLLNCQEQAATQQFPGLDFVFDRIVNSLQMRERSQYHNQRIRPNSYKAICDHHFTILEAEDNFYKLIKELSPEVHCEGRLVGKLRSKLMEQTSFTHKEIVYNTKTDNDKVLIEIYFDEPRMRNITGKKLDIIRLLYLDRKEIARRLGMELKSLDSHLSVIYDEFGTHEKKKILAATHYFPDFSRRKWISL